MPSYEFMNKDTGEVETHIMSYKDLDQFKENNPFNQVKASFYADMAMLNNALRGVKGHSTELLLTKKVHKRFSGDQAYSKMMKRDQEEGEA